MPSQLSTVVLVRYSHHYPCHPEMPNSHDLCLDHSNTHDCRGRTLYHHQFIHLNIYSINKKFFGLRLSMTLAYFLNPKLQPHHWHLLLKMTIKSCNFMSNSSKQFQGAQADFFFNFFSNFWRFWNHKKAHIFLITHGKFQSWKVFYFKDINENVSGYGNHN